MTAPALDDFHKHEAIDRCYMVQEMIETFLLNHPAVISNQIAHQMISEAQQKLSQAYQTLSQEM
jgi:hypothetical protein